MSTLITSPTNKGLVANETLNKLAEHLRKKYNSNFDIRFEIGFDMEYELFIQHKNFDKAIVLKQSPTKGAQLLFCYNEAFSTQLTECSRHYVKDVIVTGVVEDIIKYMFKKKK